MMKTKKAQDFKNKIQIEIAKVNSGIREKKRFREGQVASFNKKYQSRLPNLINQFENVIKADVCIDKATKNLNYLHTLFHQSELLFDSKALPDDVQTALEYCYYFSKINKQNDLYNILNDLSRTNKFKKHAIITHETKVFFGTEEITLDDVKKYYPILKNECFLQEDQYLINSLQKYNCIFEQSISQNNSTQNLNASTQNIPLNVSQQNSIQNVLSGSTTSLPAYNSQDLSQSLQFTQSDLPLPPQFTTQNMSQPPVFTPTNMDHPPIFTTQNLSQPPVFTPTNMQQPPQYTSQNLSQPPQFTPTNMQQPPQYTSQNLSQPPQFTPTNMQQPPQFTSQNLSQPPQFTPTNMQQPPQYSTQSLPQQPQFTPTNMSQPPQFTPQNMQQPPQYGSDLSNQQQLTSNNITYSQQLTQNCVSPYNNQQYLSQTLPQPQQVTTQSFSQVQYPSFTPLQANVQNQESGESDSEQENDDTKIDYKNPLYVNDEEEDEQ